MPPVDVPWPTTAWRGRRPGEGHGDLVNCFSAPEADEMVWRRVAGLVGRLQVPERIPRGMLPVPQGVLHAWEGMLYLWNGTSNVPPAGGSVVLSGSDTITMAVNQRGDIPDVAIVTETGNYHYNPVTHVLSSYPDGDVGAATCVEYYSGYFLWARTIGDIIASKLRQTDVDALSWARAEYADDLLRRIINNGSTVLMCGDRTTEVWQDVGASPFPLQRAQALDIGILGFWCVSGGASQWEHGVMMVASDYTVRNIRGYDAPIVSHEGVSRDIYAFRERKEELRTFVYGAGPFQYFSIVSPSWTWEYNVVTGFWHRRESYDYPTWRSRYSAYWQGRWYTQDVLEGRLGEFDLELPSEYTEKLPALIESSAIKDFPANLRIPTIDVDISTGIGATVDADYDPVVLLSWSHDGGGTWSNPLVRSMGPPGEYSRKVKFSHLGRSTHQGVKLRLEVPDPVPLALKKAVSIRTAPSRPRQVP